MKERDEEAIIACNGLLAIIERLSSSIADVKTLNNALSFALRDMASKARGLPLEIGVPLYNKAKSLALRHTLHGVIEEIDGEFSDSNLDADDDPAVISAVGRHKLRADVVLLTVIQEEFEAALRVFGMEWSEAKREFEFRGLDFFAATIPSADRRYGNRPLRVLITMVGTPRNVPCANVCRDILEKLSTDVMILIGIAGGNRRKSVKLGDVVAGEAIIDIEGGRSELVPKIGLSFRSRGFLWDRIVTTASIWMFGERKELAPRIKMDSPPSPLLEYVRKFRPDKQALQQLVHTALARYPDNVLPWSRGTAEQSYATNLHIGHIICGEKVLADGSVPEIARRHHGNILAVDMESSGFADACRHCDLQWAVFRGISDYADTKKGDRWHVPAAVAAAAAAKIFISRAYTPSDEREELW